MNILDTIGNTPLMNIDNIYFKMEMMNPSGSIKDRIAKAMIFDFMQKKQDSEKYIMVEATSGNTGISVAMVCSALKLKCEIFAPTNTSQLKLKMMRLYGASVDTFHSTIAECIEVAKEWSDINEQYYYLDQFNNQMNISAQEEMATEARLEYNKVVNNTHWDMGYHPVGAIVAGTGTGGTLMGLHNVFPNADIYEVHLVGKKPIEGITDGIKQVLMPQSMERRKIAISYKLAKQTADMLMSEYGISCGISSGANYLASIMIKEDYNSVLTVFADDRMGYL